MVTANNYRKGFSNSELSIATEAFVRERLARKREQLHRLGGVESMKNFVRYITGEIDGLEATLKFMIQNRR